MIDKAAFEAIVRAEAEERYPAVTAEREWDQHECDAVNKEHRHRRSTYIAARMEHEWPLVDALQMMLSEHPPHRDGMDNILLPFGIKRGRAALSPYTTKPIER